MPIKYTQKAKIDLFKCNKQASFKKIVMPRPAYCALFVTALIGLVTLSFDLLTSKSVHWLSVRCASIKPISGFLGLSVLELGRVTRQTDKQTYRQRRSFHNAPSLWRSGHKKQELWKLGQAPLVSWLSIVAPILWRSRQVRGQYMSSLTRFLVVLSSLSSSSSSSSSNDSSSGFICSMAMIDRLRCMRCVSFGEYSRGTM